MYRDDELDVNEEYEDIRDSKSFNPHMKCPCSAMQCPMQMPMMQQPMMQNPVHTSCKCPMCGKPTTWRDDEDLDYDEDYEYDDRYSYPRPHPHYPHFNPYYPPYFKPYPPHGPWWMKRDFEE